MQNSENAMEFRYSANFHWGREKPKDNKEEHKKVLDARKNGKNGKDKFTTPNKKKEGDHLAIESANRPDEGSAARKKELSVPGMMVLKNLNLQIKKGSFVCIIGDVGSGKSSLLSALIGDMLYLNEN